jgi:hypothetical protein
MNYWICIKEYPINVNDLNHSTYIKVGRIYKDLGHSDGNWIHLKTNNDDDYGYEKKYFERYELTGLDKILLCE